MKVFIALTTMLAMMPKIPSAKNPLQRTNKIKATVRDKDWSAIFGEIFDNLESKEMRAVSHLVLGNLRDVRDNIRPLCQTPGDLSDVNCLVSETVMDKLYPMERKLESDFPNFRNIDWDSPEVIQLRGYMLMWLTMIPLDIEREVSVDDRFAVISLLQEQIYALILKNDINGLQEFLIGTKLPTLKQIRQANIGKCSGVTNWANDLGCTWGNLLNDIYLFSRTYEVKDGKVKKISVQYDYKERLKQQQLKNLIEGAVLEINGNLADFTEQVTSVITTNFDSVGNYFTTLAQFDGEIAAMDISFINNRLDKFTEKLTNLNESLYFDATYISDATVISTSIDAALSWVRAIAKMAVGISSAIGGKFGDLISGFDAVNEATQSTINAIRAGTIPKLIKDVKGDSEAIFKGFENTRKFLTLTADLLDLEKKEGIEDIEGTRQAFLDRYDEFDPEVGTDDIARMSVKWETIVDLIGISLDGITQAGASGGKAVIYANNYIERMKFYLPQITALLQSRFNFQFDLMNTLAAYLRAKLAETSVKELKGSIEEMKDSAQDVTIIKMQAALSTLIISRIHVMTALQKHCNIIEYKNAGEVPLACSKALNTLSDEDIADAITFLPESCTVNPDGQYVSIPVTKTARSDAINLEDLYNGNETSFQIPDAQWLVDYGWVIPSDAKEKVFYVKGFEIFLVSSKESMRSLFLGVDVTPTGSASLINDENSRTKYEITSRQEYDFRYKENEHPCDRKFPNPHEWCDDLGHICVINNGLLENKPDVYPSIYSKWIVNVNDVELSRLPKMPQFVEEDKTLFLQAKVWLCSKTPTQMPEIDIERPQYDDDEAEQCGKDNYYDRKTRNWRSCPFGSVERLGGYYCEHRKYLLVLFCKR